MPTPRSIDLTGERIGRWTVLHENYPIHYHPRGRPYRYAKRVWECRCECGYEAEVFQTALRSGKSLGCRACCQKDQPNSQRAEARRLGLPLSTYRSRLKAENRHG